MFIVRQDYSVIVGTFVINVNYMITVLKTKLGRLDPYVSQVMELLASLHISP